MTSYFLNQHLESCMSSASKETNAHDQYIYLERLFNRLNNSNDPSNKSVINLILEKQLAFLMTGIHEQSELDLQSLGHFFEKLEIFGMNKNHGNAKEFGKKFPMILKKLQASICDQITIIPKLKKNTASQNKVIKKLEQFIELSEQLKPDRFQRLKKYQDKENKPLESIYKILVHRTSQVQLILASLNDNKDSPQTNILDCNQASP